MNLLDERLMGTDHSLGLVYLNLNLFYHLDSRFLGASGDLFMKSPDEAPIRHFIKLSLMFLAGSADILNYD